MGLNKTILIVDDEILLLNILDDKFSKEGFNVIKAKDGEEGLAVALKEHPDLILLDIVMPIMDGMTMLKKLRNDNWGKNVPVILLTNLLEESKIAEGMEQAVYGYFIKANWKINDVVKKVKDKLNC